LSNVRVWAADDPKQDSITKGRPAAVRLSDIEGLSNKIADLVKYAKVGVLLQHSSRSPVLTRDSRRDLAVLLKFPWAAAPISTFFLANGRDQFDR